MKITDTFKRKAIAYEDINIGAVFKYEDRYYLKTSETVSDLKVYYNCVCLNSGEHSYFKSDDMVEALKAELIVI